MMSVLLSEMKQFIWFSVNGHEETINPSEDPDDDEDEEEEDVVDDDYDYDSDSEEMKDFNQVIYLSSY